MKSLITIFAIMALLSLNVTAKTGNAVPNEVKKSLSQKYPKATEIKWEKETAKEWEAEFKLDGKEYSANFDTKGKWIETEHEIDYKDVASAVKKTLKKDFADYKILETQVTKSAKGKAYEFELCNCKEIIEVNIDINGKVTGKEQVNEEDEKCEKSEMNEKCKEHKECKENKVKK